MLKVELVSHTPNPEQTVAMAAKLCTSNVTLQELVTKCEDPASFIQKVMSMGHLSVIEHASFTFYIEGVSRALSHQLVRFRIASFSQQSQRYVRFDSGFDYVVPPSIVCKPALLQKFFEHIEACIYLYKEFVDAGIPAEDARYVFPNAANTKLMMTMNARELLHMFELRCCSHAQWEIRAMAHKILALVKPVASTIFENAGPGCVRGACPEGLRSCGGTK